MSKIFLRHTLTKKLLTFLTSLSLYIFTIYTCIWYKVTLPLTPMDITFLICEKNLKALKKKFLQAGVRDNP